MKSERDGVSQGIFLHRNANMQKAEQEQKIQIKRFCYQKLRKENILDIKPSII